ncbi:MAG: hypothetical protein WC436_03885 [Candidatus Babeliales bacterium]
MKKFIFILLSCLLGAQTLSAGLAQSRPISEQTCFLNFTGGDIEIHLIFNKENWTYRLKSMGSRIIINMMSPEEMIEAQLIQPTNFLSTDFLKKCNNIIIKATNIDGTEKIKEITLQELETRTFIPLDFNENQELIIL